MLSGDALHRLREAIERKIARQATGVEVVLDYGASLENLIKTLQQAGETIEGETVSRGATWSYLLPSSQFGYDERTIGLWHFEEGSGGQAADASPNGNTLTLVDTTWTSGKWGSGLSFNGSSSYCYGSLTYTERLGHYLYVAGWFNPSGNGPLIYWPSVILLAIDSGRLVVTIDSVDYVGPSVQTGEWQLLHCQFFDGRVYLGVNDVITWHDHSSEELSPLYSTFYVGRDDTSYYNGLADEILVAADVFVQEDFQYPRDWAYTSSIGHWRFNEGAGNMAFNLLMSYRPLTLVNHTWTDGWLGSAVAFNADGYAYYAQDATNLSRFGLEMCVQFDDVSASQVLAYQEGALRVTWSPGQLEVYIASLTPATFTFELPTISSSNWYIISVQYDNNAVTAWLNGLKVGEASASGTVDLASANFLLGGDGTNGLIGKLDYAMINRGPVRPFYRVLPRWLIGQHGFERADDWILL
ncbi:MAG: hypothetical protein JRD89_00125 [Deltaproteobacteria bacterium]|nr:hypothetical protein [Deltaproteobacteria bacterium]